MYKQTNINRFQALDTFRGLSAIFIVLFHSQFYSSSTPNQFIRHSDIFVDFFFVLSGFVIAYSYQLKISKGIKFKDFILLRLARLYPLHFFMLLIWVPYIGIKIYLYQKGIGITDPTEVNNLFTFIKNIFLLQGMGSKLSWNYPSWSIGAEFYTYILFFIVLFFSKKLFKTSRILIIFLVSLLAYWITNTNYIEEVRFVGVFSCISGFFFGVIIYYVYENIDFRINDVMIASLLEAGILLLMVFFVSNIEENNYNKQYAIISFMGIVYLFSIQNVGHVSKVLNFEIFQHLGKISYSIYMTHAIIVTGTYNVLMYVLKLQEGGVKGVPSGIVFEYAFYLDIFFIIFVVGISTLTYKYIETPGQLYFKKKVYKDEA